MDKLTRLPNRHDPRIPVACILLGYLVLGTTVLGFNRSPVQIASVIGMACMLDVALHRLIYRQWLFPLSAIITGMSLSILVNYAHGSLLPVIPVFMAVASKYVLTFRGKHVFNPALFGIVAALLLGQDMMSVSPAYQWGGYPAMAVFVVTAAIVTFILKINRLVLILSFLGFYTIALCVRAWLTQHHVPPETLFMGALTSPAFYLFAFFMITDPATSPPSKWGQFFAAFCIVLIDFYLHTRESLYTFFYAGFIFLACRFLYLHATAFIKKSGVTFYSSLRLRSIAVVSALGLCGWLVISQLMLFEKKQSAQFKYVAIPVQQSGLHASDGDMLAKVDERIKHIAKWVLSVGDAVAVADYDNDGLQDIFLTYPLKSADARGALYRNRGDFKFERVELTAINDRMQNHQQGLPSTALWFDSDNDGDSDLFIGMGYGDNIFLRNNLMETGKAEFTDETQSMALDDYSVSIAANALDADNDGYLDLIVGNSLNPWLPDYSEPTRLNVFDLPKPVNDTDRRMFNFMHRTWHNADNGGENYFYHNKRGNFERQSSDSTGLTGHRWTIDIGTGDFDNDGDTDLYLANDFGPDDLFLNDNGHFTRSAGRLTGQLGNDTYKGMNVSVADIDNNGSLDIYVSNVHEPLQAEGSLLWMNNGTVASSGWRGFSDKATAKNALNERRFGWGATIGDLNLDGRLDLLQANGMVGDEYDNLYEGCPDYWYWNDQIALTGPNVHGYADKWADLQGRCIFPNEPDRLLINQGQYFVDVAADAGWDDQSSSRGIATADFDNDGDLDTIVTRQFMEAALYENVGSHKHNWLGLEMAGNGISCNSDAVGSKVVVTAQPTESNDSAPLVQMRERHASNGFSSQNDGRLLFGLGNRTGPVSVSINWCGHANTTYTLKTNQYHVLQQPIVSGADKQASSNH